METFYDRYGAAEGITSVALERRMMQMMSAQAAQRDDSELARLLDEIGFIRVLTTTDDTDRKSVYLRESKLDEDKELVVITHGEDETTVVHIFGSFDVREISRITSIRPR